MTAESLRRAGNPAAAVDMCRDALIRFPGHLSARVTLGWALLDLEKFREAQQEFETVRKTAPDNLAAIRGLAKLHTLHDAETFNDSDLHQPDESRDLDPYVEPPQPAIPSLPPAPVQWSAPALVEPVEPDSSLLPADFLELDAYDLAMCGLGFDPAPVDTSARYMPKFKPFEAFEPAQRESRLTECA